MQYGVCGGPDRANEAADAGFDYFEWSVGEFLKPNEDEQAFAESLAAVEAAPLPCPTLNGFLPGSPKITGPDADLGALEIFVTTAFSRAQTAGVTTIVFGSGDARAIPDGFDRRTAWDQLLAFGRMLAPIAEAHDVTVVVEPLNVTECNVLTSVAESAGLVREVDHPALRLLVDGYHMLKDDDAMEDIVVNADIIRHAHVATVPTRLAPGAEQCDKLDSFFDGLARGGYAHGLSIEGGIPDPAQDLPAALKLMRASEG